MREIDFRSPDKYLCTDEVTCHTNEKSKRVEVSEKVRFRGMNNVIAGLKEKVRIKARKATQPKPALKNVQSMKILPQNKRIFHSSSVTRLTGQ